MISSGKFYLFNREFKAVLSVEYRLLGQLEMRGEINPLESDVLVLTVDSFRSLRNGFYIFILSLNID